MVRTETATIVFTDLVGSTGLANRLGHDAYEAMRREHFGALRIAAAQHRGDEIKSTGDGIVFAFGSAADALASMIRMQQVTDLAARRHGGDPRIRIGASCGEINREDHDIFGISVVEAARLCAAAAPEQILVAELVSQLVRGLGYRFGKAKEFDLKGMPEPVRACLVEWEPRSAPDGTVPLPPKIVSPLLGLYGRAAEQATVARSWAAARQGHRQVVLIAGEPGIGKTRHAIDAARIAHGEGALVLFGSCDEEIGQPYRPFVEALRHYLAHAPEEILLRHVREHQGELLRMLPELGHRVPDIPPPRVAEPETERFLMFEAVAGLLSAASQQNPVVLILDDLQWARAPELLLLKHLVRSALPMHLLIIVTYRDTELSRTHPLAAVLADLRRETGIERIALRGLDAAGVIAFVTAAAGHDLDPPELALARAIGEETEGSPLFIAETLRNLIESGAVVRQGDRWVLRAGSRELGIIPQGVKEAIGRRLSRLTGSTNKILSLASVIGREFDLALLEQFAEMEEDAILDAIDEAKAAALVAEVGGEVERYAFTHALVRATLYDEISPARRARMHRRVGAALERLTETRPGQRVDELARHWMAATTIGDLSKAIAYARQAAERALDGLAFEEAAKYYEQSLAALTHHDRDGELLRCDLTIALSDAQRRAGEADYRRAMTEAVTIARAVGDARRLALAVLVSARPGGTMANATVVDHELIALFEEALAGLGDEDDDVLRAKLLAQLSVELLYTGEFDRRHRLSAEAVEIARRSGDESVLAFALYAHAATINVPTALAERLALTAEMEALGERSGSIETRWNAAYHRFGALLESGDIAGAEQKLVRLRELIPKLRQPYFNWATSLAGAMLAVMRGEGDAEQQVSAAFELGRASGQPDAAMVQSGQLFVIRRDQGRYGEQVEPLRQLVMAQPHLPVWGATLAGLYCETDQLEQARAQVALLAANDFRLPVDWTWPSIVMSLAQVASDLDDQRLAGHFYPQLRQVSGQVGVTSIGILCYGSLALPCGLLAACLKRCDEADRYFGEAAAMNERIGAKPYLVRTRRAWAAMLIDRNAPEDRGRIEALLVAARVAAAELGMAREIVRLERLGERMGGDRRASGI